MQLDNRGYTLVELVVVMAIMALLAGMAMPSCSRLLESARLESDARQMASLLRLARQQAITTGQPSTVIFYPGNAKYKLIGASYRFLQPGIRFIGSTTFTSKQGGQPICGFSPLGAPTSGGTVTLANSYQRWYVIVNPVVGRIRVSASPPGSE
jgi:general secretion pathway protein H